MTVEKITLASNPHLSSYISGGCNRTSNCLDWSSNGFLCYGVCNSVAVCDFTNGVGQARIMLNKHKGRVNSVKWIRGGPDYKSTELISSSSDNTVVVWRLVSGEIKPISIMTSHSMPVNIVDGLYSSEFPEQGYPDTYIASTSGDSTLKLWLRKQFQEELTCISTVNINGGGVCLSLCLTLVPESRSLILAVGTDDCNIHLYSEETKLLTLSGHEDWVKCLHFTSSGKDLLLASGSQDTTIRLWRISRKVKVDSEDNEFRLPEQAFTLQDVEYVVSLESLLMGHEGWVTSLQWKPNSDGKQLVSCSIDRTILLWEVEEATGVWLETSRLGELGGNTLGYLAITFSPDTKTLLANSHQGALHMWSLQEEGIWKSVGCLGGHFEGVVDVSWESGNGRYLLSCSTDKTTRLHAPWTKNTHSKGCWFEMSRPQVHGHSMSGLAALPGFSLASASEEKVVRVFTAPDNVLYNLANLTDTFAESERRQGEAPLGAAVPSLGLSNKAVFQDEQHEKCGQSNPKDEYSDGYFTPQNLSEPPTEDNLAQNTLWPEVMKLYGHGFEVFTLAATHTGDLLATSCKASSALHAKILLWETGGWSQVGELEGHNLTVTQMEFSPDDTKLISVSRDRTWCLFTRTEEGTFKLLLKSEKQVNPHSRIIWCCGWSHEGLYFATGSRDGKVAVWPGESLHILASRPPASVPLSLQQSVTALAFTRTNMVCLPPLNYLLAVGLETGTIHAYLWHPTAWTFLFTVPSAIGHHLTVSRLCFRPTHGRAEVQSKQADENLVQLASCSLDHTVRIFTIDVKHWVDSLKSP